jgi:hypothetical protein
LNQVLAVDAVTSEPVSAENSLLTGKYTGNLIDFLRQVWRTDTAICHIQFG